MAPATVDPLGELKTERIITRHAAAGAGVIMGQAGR
jgi:hypothetical protein